MPTLRGNPCRRVHPARTLEGELDVSHADPGCHIFINLLTQKKAFLDTDINCFSFHLSYMYSQDTGVTMKITLNPHFILTITLLLLR